MLKRRIRVFLSYPMRLVDRSAQAVHCTQAPNSSSYGIFPHGSDFQHSLLERHCKVLVLPCLVFCRSGAPLSTASFNACSLQRLQSCTASGAALCQNACFLRGECSCIMAKNCYLVRKSKAQSTEKAGSALHNTDQDNHLGFDEESIFFFIHILRRNARSYVHPVLSQLGWP